MRAIQIGDVTRLAEAVDPERIDRATGGAAQPGQCRRVTVEHGDQRRIAGERREQLLDHGVGGLAPRPPLLHRAPVLEQPVGRSDHEHPEPRQIVGERIGCLEQLRQNRAGADQGDLCARSRLA